MQGNMQASRRRKSDVISHTNNVAGLGMDGSNEPGGVHAHIVFLEIDSFKLFLLFVTELSCLVVMFF